MSSELMEFEAAIVKLLYKTHKFDPVEGSMLAFEISEIHNRLIGQSEREARISEVERYQFIIDTAKDVNGPESTIKLKTLGNINLSRIQTLRAESDDD